VEYKHKWQDALLRRLRAGARVEVYTRDEVEIRYITELEEAGRLRVVGGTPGVIVCEPAAGDNTARGAAARGA